MTISTSPLCPHVEQGSGEGWLRLLSVKPKAVKVFQSGHAREVKAVDGQITTVRRRHVADQGSYLAQGQAGGRRFVEEIAEDLAGVDILEGLNEATGFEDEGVLRQNNEFHLGFVEQCRARGVKPAVLNIAVGNPREDLVRLLAPCVQAAVLANGYVGYHGYGPKDILAAEEYYAMRGPLKLEPLLRAAGVTGKVQWIYTEAGYDVIGGQASGPWRKLGLSEAELEDGHERYARRLKELGVTMAFLYTFWGTDEWKDYEYTGSELMSYFGRHWQEWAVEPPPPPPPPPPSTDVLYTLSDGYRTYFRSAPTGGEESKAGKLAEGHRVRRVREQGEWTRVLVEGQDRTQGKVHDLEGWVAKSRLTVTPPGGSARED